MIHFFYIQAESIPDSEEEYSTPEEIVMVNPPKKTNIQVQSKCTRKSEPVYHLPESEPIVQLGTNEIYEVQKPKKQLLI